MTAADTDSHDGQARRGSLVAAGRHVAALHIDDIAAAAGVASAARAVSGSVTALVLHHLAGLIARLCWKALLTSRMPARCRSTKSWKG